MSHRAHRRRTPTLRLVTLVMATRGWTSPGDHDGCDFRIVAGGPSVVAATNQGRPCEQETHDVIIHPHDPQDTTGVDVGASTAFVGARTIRGAYALLKIRGLSSLEAGNVVAYIAGLHAAATGWTVEEIEDLIAMRSIAAYGGFE
jgi:hypothetical protein